MALSLLLLFVVVDELCQKAALAFTLARLTLLCFLAFLFLVMFLLLSILRGTIRPVNKFGCKGIQRRR